MRFCLMSALYLAAVGREGHGGRERGGGAGESEHGAGLCDSRHLVGLGLARSLSLTSFLFFFNLAQNKKNPHELLGEFAIFGSL
jgi:hypothetical protein